MTLFHLLLNLHELSPQNCSLPHCSADQLIYVELPWTLESQAIVIQSVSAPVSKQEIDHICYHYFLELRLAQKLLQIYASRNLCLADHCQRVIEYAMQTRVQDL